jgi:asparaginyl-tRNA synthetase
MDEVKTILSHEQAWVGKEVEIAGWVKSVRKAKACLFMVVNDGTCFNPVQVVVDEGAENFDELSRVTIGSSLGVRGMVVESPGAGQAVEIKASRVEVIGLADADFPIQKKRHSFEYLRTVAHLRPRTNTFTAVFRMRSLLAYALHRFFNDRGFVYVHTPIITGSDCEGAGQMFRVTTFDLSEVPRTAEGLVDVEQDFFGRETNLTVSGQLAVENYCMNFRNVYTFGPTFRAENSNTARHASEFWMIEPEMAFTDLTGNMNTAEAMLKYLCRYALDQGRAEMAFFDQYIQPGVVARLEEIVEKPFHRITYSEAVELLLKSGASFEFPVKWGMDLQTEHERFLTEKVFTAPVFVVDYPKEIKAFYMRQNPDGRTVAAMDLLVPGVGEIIGGSQREERYDELLRRIEEMGLRKEDYQWYLDLRRFGTAPHSGYGLGFERLIMYVTGMTNIRDVIPFPRTPKNADF